MKLVKSLTALALIGSAIPTAHALSIKDDEVKLGVGVRLQTRVTMASAETPSGDDFSVQEGVAAAPDGTVDESMYFTIPRARLYLKGAYGENWKFQLTFMADKIEDTGYNTNRGVNIRYAWVERQFKQGETIVHGVKFGLDKPYFNDSDVLSSSSRLLPTPRNTEEYLKPRGIGIGYMVTGSMFRLAVDLQNGLSSTGAPAGAPTAGINGSAYSADPDPTESEGYFYSFRAEFAPMADWFIAKRTESFAGVEGQGLVFGIGYGADNDRHVQVAGLLPTTNSYVRTATSLHTDVLFHWHAITAMFTLATLSDDRSPVTGGVSNATNDVEIKGRAWNFQAGYAFTMENGTALETVFRISMRDDNTDNDEEGPNYGAANADVGASGETIELGLNYYLNGHSNKFQLGYMMWKGEEQISTGDEASANIFRLQHQLNF